MKKIVQLILVSSLSIFVGCSDKPSEEKKEPQVVSDSTQAAKIEVVANEQAHAIKVEEKVKEDHTKNGKNYYFSYGVKSGYDPNSIPANKDASVREKPRTKVDANLHVRSPYEEVQISMLVKKLSKEFMVKCSACHNDYANGVIGPSLLSKSVDEILTNISDFKSGKKSNPLMDDLIKMMSDKEIESLATEIFEFNQKIQDLKSK